jgi:hypothetical protein
MKLLPVPLQLFQQWRLIRRRTPTPSDGPARPKTRPYPRSSGRSGSPSSSSSPALARTAWACARSALLSSESPQGHNEPRVEGRGPLRSESVSSARTLRDRAFRVPLRGEKPGALRRAWRRCRSGVAWSESGLCHLPRIWPHPSFGARLPPRSRSRLRRGVVSLRLGGGDIPRIVVHKRSDVVALYPGAESSSREADGAGSGTDGARQEVVLRFRSLSAAPPPATPPRRPRSAPASRWGSPP